MDSIVSVNNQYVSGTVNVSSCKGTIGVIGIWMKINRFKHLQTY